MVRLRRSRIDWSDSEIVDINTAKSPELVKIRYRDSENLVRSEPLTCRICIFSTLVRNLNVARTLLTDIIPTNVKTFSSNFQSHVDIVVDDQRNVVFLGNLMKFSTFAGSARCHSQPSGTVYLASRSHRTRAFSRAAARP